jgi:hypothetical protein
LELENGILKENKVEYKTVYKEESFGGSGSFGLEIKIGASKLPDLKKGGIQTAIREAADKIENEVMTVIKQADPKTNGEVENNKKILSLFGDPIFVEEIPNEYCGNWCCRHLPWFIVTTKVGRIKIGWRKRVISIDWSDTANTLTSFDLFPNDDVTKGNKIIHAWGYEDAKRYISTIISSALI